MNLAPVPNPYRRVDLPAWAQGHFNEMGDSELWRLRREGPALNLLLHFSEKLLLNNLPPTRDLLVAVAETLEDDPGEVQEVVNQALQEIRHLGIYSTTDVANADRFADQHAGSVLYCRALGGWHVWDGRRWAADRIGKVMERAKETARSIYREAAVEPVKARSDALAQWAKFSQDAKRIRAMVDLAQSAEGIAASAEAFDVDPWLLNVLNGTLDLRTGALHPHDPCQLITMLAPVHFDSDARHPLWDQFLEQKVPDPDQRSFLARAAGYTLTGDTGEEVLFLGHGAGGAGMTTFAEAFRSALGDYAITADFETFLRKREAGIRNDVARLAGKRFVVSLEMEEGRHLAVALVKSLTGGDTVSARFLHREFFDFRPVFKLWLFANHKPKAKASDGGLWRRVLLLPFTRSVPKAEQNAEVKRVLTQDPNARSAILAWAVRGLIEWRERGLRVPEVVQTATAAYREECDEMAEFFEDYCVFDREAKSTAAELRRACDDWCKANGVTTPDSKALAAALTGRGCKAGKVGGDRGWKGVGLKAAEDRRDG